MEISDASVTFEDNGFTDERMLFTYSEEEKQQQEINEANARLVFNWNFLIMPREVFDLGLNGNEAIILAFVSTYRGKNNRFYFTNDQLASMFNLSVNGVSAILVKLSKEKLINLSYRRKSNGGQIRFISLMTPRKWEYQLPESRSSNSQKVGGIYNKIKENKINIRDTVVVDKPTTVEIERFLEGFNTLFTSKYRVTPKRSRQLKERLKAYSFEEIMEALSNLGRSSFHRGENQRGWVADPDFLIRSDEQIDKFLNVESTRKVKPLVIKPLDDFFPPDPVIEMTPERQKKADEIMEKMRLGLKRIN